MNKLLLTLSTAFNLSFQPANHTQTTRLFNENLELLRGSVKKLVEVKHDHTTESEYPLSIVITTDFNKNGKTSSTLINDIWAKKEEKTEYSYTYSTNGRELKTIVLSRKGVTQVYRCYNGHISELTLYWSKRKLIGKLIYKYDNTGNLVEQNPIKGDYYSKIKYRYDDKFNLIEEDEFYGKETRGVKTRHLYKLFDAKGNWLKEIRIEEVNRSTQKNSAFPADTIERKITYY